MTYIFQNKDFIFLLFNKRSCLVRDILYKIEMLHIRLTRSCKNFLFIYFTQTHASHEHISRRAWIQCGHSATLIQDHHRDEPHHIAQLLHRGQFPVGAVAAVAHGPDNECTRCTRLEDGSGKTGAIQKCTIANIDQRFWCREGGDPTASAEHIIPQARQRIW